jgi:hypothetical protein
MKKPDAEVAEISLRNAEIKSIFSAILSECSVLSALILFLQIAKSRVWRRPGRPDPSPWIKQSFVSVGRVLHSNP